MVFSPLESFNLEGKTAVVTGGAGILGRHFVIGLSSVGAKVAVVDLHENDAKKVANEAGPNAIGFGCDVSDPSSVQRCVENIVKKFGHIDILHNNAATKTKDPKKFFTEFENFPLDVWRDIMSVNIDGMFLMAQAVGKQFINQGKGGAVIQTASIYGIVAPDPRIYEGSEYLGGSINTPAAYAASKAAVIGFTKWLSTHWAPSGIRVNCLVPGGVSSGQNSTFTKQYANRVPMGRMATAEEMVPALLYLASDASSYVTGQVMVVDGGLTVW